MGGYRLQPPPVTDPLSGGLVRANNGGSFSHALSFISKPGLPSVGLSKQASIMNIGENIGMPVLLVRLHGAARALS